MATNFKAIFQIISISDQGWGRRYVLSSQNSVSLSEESHVAIIKILVEKPQNVVTFTKASFYATLHNCFAFFFS